MQAIHKTIIKCREICGSYFPQARTKIQNILNFNSNIITIT